LLNHSFLPFYLTVESEFRATIILVVFPLTSYLKAAGLVHPISRSGHWRIENRGQTVRGATFYENYYQIRNQLVLGVMVALWKFAISILRFVRYANIGKALRHIAAKPHFTLGVIDF
jgi:hypothetical protein